jgi:hypothetical protein
MNWKGYGRKRSWPNLKYGPRICLEGLRKTTKTSVKYEVSGPRSEPRTTQIPSRSDGTNCVLLRGFSQPFYVQGSKAMRESGLIWVGTVSILFAVLHALARAKNTLWARPCLSVCLSLWLNHRPAETLLVLQKHVRTNCMLYLAGCIPSLT